MVGILSDRQITEYVKRFDMIEPYNPGQTKLAEGIGPVLSWGQGSYSYDIRVASEFKVFRYKEGLIVDPKNFDPDLLVTHSGDYVILPPHGFCLAYSVEKFNLPRNVTGLVVGKSTYARAGILTPLTPMESGWSGHLTLEISNMTPIPAKVYAGEGIAAIIFLEGSQPCAVSYADRNSGLAGKYQNQKAKVVLPRM